MTEPVLHIDHNSELDVPSALDAVSSRSLWAVVVELDSDRQPAALRSLRAATESPGSFGSACADAWLVNPLGLKSLLQSRIFNGFDEVWLSSAQPMHWEPPPAALTSDAPFPPPDPAAVANWMRSTGVIAGLGDGDGLNSVASDTQLAECWSAWPGSEGRRVMTCQ